MSENALFHFVLTRYCDSSAYAEFFFYKSTRSITEFMEKLCYLFEMLWKRLLKKKKTRRMWYNLFKIRDKGLGFSIEEGENENCVQLRPGQVATDRFPVC